MRRSRTAAPPRKGPFLDTQPRTRSCRVPRWFAQRPTYSESGWSAGPFCNPTRYHLRSTAHSLACPVVEMQEYYEVLGGLLIRLGCQTRLAAPHSCKFDMPRVNSQERATRDQAHHRATYLVMETAELQTAPLRLDKSCFHASTCPLPQTDLGSIHSSSRCHPHFLSGYPIKGTSTLKQRTGGYMPIYPPLLVLWYGVPVRPQWPPMTRGKSTAEPNY